MSIRIVLAVIGGVIAFVAVMWAVGIISVFGSAETARITNKPREQILVFEPNRSLATYEGFYDTCNAFNAVVRDGIDATGQADALEKTYDPEADSFGNQRQSISAVRENARGLRNKAREVAAGYNADSSKNSRTPFKASDLPYTLDPAGAELADCGTPKETGR